VVEEVNDLLGMCSDNNLKAFTTADLFEDFDDRPLEAAVEMGVRLVEKDDTRRLSKDECEQLDDWTKPEPAE
jgi:hypothetical protein